MLRENITFVLIIYILLSTLIAPSSVSSEIHKCVSKEGEIVYTTNPNTVEGCINKTEIPKQKNKDVEINTELEYEANEKDDNDQRYKTILKQETKTDDLVIENNINSYQNNNDQENLSEDNSLTDKYHLVERLNQSEKQDTYNKVGSNQQRIKHYEKVLENCLKSAVPTSREIKCGKFRKKLEEEYEKAHYITSEDPLDNISNITSHTKTLEIRLKKCVTTSPPSPSRDYNCWKLEKKIIDITNFTTCRPNTIIDEYTFNCIMASGAEKTIRLIGIGTPELDKFDNGLDALTYSAHLLGMYNYVIL